MKDEAVMEIKVEDAIQKLAEVCVELKREIAQLKTTVADQNATIAQLEAKITVLTALVDQHQLRLEGRKPGGSFNA